MLDLLHLQYYNITNAINEKLMKSAKAPFPKGDDTVEYRFLVATPINLIHMDKE